MVEKVMPHIYKWSSFHSPENFMLLLSFSWKAFALKGNLTCAV